METKWKIESAYSDDRGDIFNVFEGNSGHIALITSKKGSVRANHYHKEDLQYIYLVSGAYESHCCPVDDPSNKQVLEVKPGEIVKTPPLIAHAQVFTEDSVFLAITTRQREQGKYEDDTIAFNVVEGYINPALKKA